jgi:outer membrane receptor protein involved in Fe transport
MRKKFSFVLLMFSILLGLNIFIFGQERTGTIEGTIKDQTGAVVPNATVVVTGNAFTRTVTSSDDGFFRVQQVPPGSYTVVVSAGNFDKVTKSDVLVSLGAATTLDTELKASVGAVVNVTTEGVATIDTTASKIQTNLGAKQLEDLPKGTNFDSSLKAAAPVRVEPTANGFQIDGASGSENSFVLDGQEVTNFRTGTLNANNNIPFQLVQEVQIKSNGFEAEYGGATGGVINVVTKRGSDDWHGEIGQQLETSKLFARPRQILNASTSVPATAANRYFYPQNDKFTNMFPSFYLGGSLIKNRLYFFASSAPQFFDVTRDFTFPGNVTKSYTSKIRRDYDFVRLDGQVTDKLQVNATYLYNPLKQNGALPLHATLFAVTDPTKSPNEAAQAQLGGRIPATNYSFEGTYTPTQNLSINVRYGKGYLNEKIENFGSTSATTPTNYSYGIPQITRYTCPTFACSLGGAGSENIPTNSVVLKDISIRNTFDAAAGVYLNNFGGRHNFKFGYQYNGLSNDVDKGYVSLGLIQINMDPAATANDANGVTRGPTNAADFAAGVRGVGALNLVGTFGKAASKNQALYAQDSWQINNRLTLNLGLRVEKEDIPSFKAGAPGINFDWTDKLAPRIGVAFDVLGNGKWKAFGSYGRFFDRFKYELSRGSFGGDVQLIYTFLVKNPDVFSYTYAGVIANNINITDQRIPSNDPSDNRIDPNIKPFQQQEYTFGTAYDFGAGFILEGRYTHKNIIRTIDDIGYHQLTGATQNEFYYIGNPGEGVCAQPACGQYSIPGAVAAKATRIYDAVETRIQKRFGSFSVDSSYTWSRLFGNYSGSASSDEAQRRDGGGRSSPNVSRYYDLPFIGFTANGQPDDGPLPTDRPHFFKFSGNYLFGWWGSKSNSTSFNAFYQIGSGTPITTRARLGGVTGMIVNGRGDLGRTEAFSQTDVSLTHKYKFGRDNRFAMAFDINVLNLWNQANELSRRETLTRVDAPYATFGCTTDVCIDRAFFNGGITAAKVLAYANIAGNKDERYNLPQLFQAPRAVRFGFRFMF